jgi:hypothetical protein
MQLSKKQNHELWAYAATATALLLISFPPFLRLPTPPGAFSWHFGLIAFLAFGLARLLQHHLPIPHPLRLVLWLPIVLPPSLLFHVWSGPLSPLVVLFSWALLLFSLTRGWRQELCTLALLLLAAFAFQITLSHYPPAPDIHLPRLLRWAPVPLLGIPLIFRITSSTRPIAHAMLRLELLVLMATLFCLPLLWSIATSAKQPGELVRNFYSLHPETRYEPIPDLPPPLPADLAARPDAIPLLRFLDEHLRSISHPTLLRLFGQQAPLTPDEMIRAFKIYGFLQEDTHGTHVPDTLFSPKAGDNISPDFQPWIHKLQQHTRISSENAQDLLPALMDLGWVLPIPGESGTFRLSAQARRPLSNGFRPRQILALEADSPLSVETYRQRYGLSAEEATQELQALLKAGLTEERAWVWDAHPFLLRDVREALLLLAVLALALVMPCVLPARHIYPVAILLLAAWTRLPSDFLASSPLPLQAARFTLLLPVSLVLLFHLSRAKVRVSGL